MRDVTVDGIPNIATHPETKALTTVSAVASLIGIASGPRVKRSMHVSNLDVLEDPMQCKDGHNFCKDCITRCLGHKQICPLGTNALELDSLSRNLFAENMVNNLKVYCHLPESDGQSAANTDTEAYELKCDWTGELQSLAQHRETCPFQQVQCPNVNCNANIQRRELEDHDKICEYKVVECEKCTQALVRLEVRFHNKIYCPEEVVPCPNGCRSLETGQINEIKRINLDNHTRNDCGKTILDCPFKDQGCLVQVERQHVDKHVQDNMAAHMMLLAKQCSSLTKQNSSLTEQCSALKQNVLSLTEENRLLKDEVKQQGNSFWQNKKV
ncbi:TNF receptor-associated factor 5-like [Actinia tenebrosa]|uniref:TNF receptor-associated factor 5-like n=1 Tax=Actinia tenebrosa TaxID=6105 RepID=A0A6P8II48_ACTTE|nr:TNF receptor-associated factor 5-like [Actinia tenebrosa]